MSKRAVFERSRRELSLDVSVGIHIILWSNRAWKVSLGGVPRLRYLRDLVRNIKKTNTLNMLIKVFLTV